jgi:hypothetical protein
LAAEWEQYKDRFTQRPETYDAYVDVWTRNPSSRMHFSSWATFSQCASAEPKRQREEAHHVRRAESMMAAAGYEIGQPTARGARRWFKTGAR